MRLAATAVDSTDLHLRFHKRSPCSSSRPTGNYPTCPSMAPAPPAFPQECDLFLFLSPHTCRKCRSVIAHVTFSFAVNRPYTESQAGQRPHQSTQPLEDSGQSSPPH